MQRCAHQLRTDLAREGRQLNEKGFCQLLDEELKDIPLPNVKDVISDFERATDVSISDGESGTLKEALTQVSYAPGERDWLLRIEAMQ